MGGAIAAAGKLMFLASAVLTLIVAFWALRRGSGAAGWSLIAWGLLETATIMTALRFNVSDGGDAQLLRCALPLAMAVATMFVTLGVADRLRAAIQAELRQSDAVARFSGNALVVILSGADSALVGPIVERIGARVAAVRVDDFGEPRALTCGVGFAATNSLAM